MSANYENLTLRAALSRFREDNDLVEKYSTTGPDSKDLLDRHDIMHVLFGLNTTLKQEAMADYWTIFGSDAKWADLRKYFDLPEQKELIEDLGWPTLVGSTLVSLPIAIRIALRSRKLIRKWPWNEHESYLDVAVAEIRKEFGIDRILSKA